MQIITEIPELDTAPKAIALGTFDGVHLGHRAVILSACESAKKEGLIPSVFTFSGLPKNAFLPEPLRVTPLTAFGEKAALIEALGAELMFAPPFTRETAAIPAEEFAREILIRRLGARHIVCGSDHRFGAGGRGDAALLHTICRETGCALTVIPPVALHGRRISSTLIRSLLLEGRVDDARELLGHGI